MDGRRQYAPLPTFSSLHKSNAGHNQISRRGRHEWLALHRRFRHSAFSSPRSSSGVQMNGRNKPICSRYSVMPLYIGMDSQTLLGCRLDQGPTKKLVVRVSAKDGCRLLPRWMMCCGWPGMTKRGRRAMLLAIVGQIAKSLAQISCLTPLSDPFIPWLAVELTFEQG